jgi:protein-S-isoprenylcysteine O-methyltransferase Ste14
MEEKSMNILGVGPLLAAAGGVGLAIVLALLLLGLTIPLPSPWQDILTGLGIVSLAVGVYLWLSSAVLVERAFKAHRLETSGAFRFSRNPLYAAFIVFIVPGIALIFNDLMILCISITMFIVFKMLIGREEEFLRREFGSQFQEYALKVPRLIPFLKV